MALKKPEREPNDADTLGYKVTALIVGVVLTYFFAQPLNAFFRSYVVEPAIAFVGWSTDQ